MDDGSDFGKCFAGAAQYASVTANGGACSDNVAAFAGDGVHGAADEARTLNTKHLKSNDVAKFWH